MKRAIVALLLLPLLYCNRESGGSKEGGDFIYTPGSRDKITLDGTSYQIGNDWDANDCSSSLPDSHCFAIIYTGTIDENKYVGIAVSDDPDDPAAFNLKIYFSSASIPSSIDLSTEPTAAIKVTDNSGTYTYSSGSFTLTFTAQPDNIYRIQSSGTASLSGGIRTLTGLDIYALKVGN
jgi:hypothetical protein